VINALGTTSYVKEEVLMSMLRDFIAELASSWTTRYPFLQKILQLKTLPFKANLLTRFYELDELTAPLDAQSVYIEIENHLHKGKI
jgi:siderophore synthetase component